MKVKRVRNEIVDYIIDYFTKSGVEVDRYDFPVAFTNYQRPNTYKLSINPHSPLNKKQRDLIEVLFMDNNKSQSVFNQTGKKEIFYHDGIHYIDYQTTLTQGGRIMIQFDANVYQIFITYHRREQKLNQLLD